jgi:hypothetical protein
MKKKHLISGTKNKLAKACVLVQREMESQACVRANKGCKPLAVRLAAKKPANSQCSSPRRPTTLLYYYRPVKSFEKDKESYCLA